jgi:sucrose-6-phosphate hydrolase SacC (GH32 family)
MSGRLLLFSENGWDATQKAGYLSLVNTEWGGSYEPERFDGKFWMSYLGGSDAGYEAGKLKTGMAFSSEISEGWQRLPEPVLSPDDDDAEWYDNGTIYKSLVIRDEKELTGYRFVMFYNAKGDTARYESIAMAVSDDMKKWERYGDKPLISRFRHGTICGDAQIARIGDVYVMFYFGAFWGGEYAASEKFACSYDLVHWTEWNGPDLIVPSEPYDKKYAHKPWVVKWKGVVYHFYNAVGDNGRVIALAASRKLK